MSEQLGGKKERTGSVVVIQESQENKSTDGAEI